MTASLTPACLWAIIASVVATVPRRFHRPGAVVMVVTGIPLPGWVTWQNGPLWGMPVLAGEGVDAAPACGASCAPPVAGGWGARAGGIARVCACLDLWLR
jgi:hypothetical protein